MLPDSSNFTMGTKVKLRIASLLYLTLHHIRLLFALRDHTRARRAGILWELDLKEGIDLSIFLLGGFEKEYVKACIEVLRGMSEPIVMDIGANIGAYTLPLAKAVATQKGVVHAFEPTRWGFDKLRKNVEGNPGLCGHIVANQTFLSSGKASGLPEAIESSWPVTGSEDAHHVHLGEKRSTEGASTDSLDGYVASMGLRRLDLIKLDVDGNEADVLDGSMESIQIHRPVILMEWCPELDVSGRLRRHIERLALTGYQTYLLKGGGRIACDPSALERSLPRKYSWMILLVHSEGGARKNPSC